MNLFERAIAIRTKLRQIETLLAEIYELAKPVENEIDPAIAGKAEAAWKRADKAVAALHAAMNKAAKTMGDVVAQIGK